MNYKQVFALIGILVIAFILAFYLQEVVRLAVVIPIAYLWWILRLVYRAVPQVVFWGLLVIFVVIQIINSLTSFSFHPGTQKEKKKGRPGKVEKLAKALDNSEKGIYFKWLIAHRLGKLVRDFLIQRGDQVNKKGYTSLIGRDWHPSKKISAYLEAGLNGSFSDYPNPVWPFGHRPATPLDLEAREVVEYLETQIENHNGY